MSNLTSLADRINDLLPQTQCTKCGYSACRPYAEAIAAGDASYNQCPPGGAEGIARLAHLLGRPVIPLNPAHGIERPRPVAVIDESACIGCTLCIQACPVDAIIGAPKQMHSIITALCTGCDLCLPPCPVDCISMVNLPHAEHTGWDAWTTELADAARSRYMFRQWRLTREKQDNTTRLLAKAADKLRAAQSEAVDSDAQSIEKARKLAIISAAMLRAKIQQEQPLSPPPAPYSTTMSTTTNITTSTTTSAAKKS